MSNIDDEIVRAVLGKPLPDGYPVPNFVEKIKQLITDARVDELEALIEKIECERPDCTTDHSNLRKKYVTNRIKELKENKL